MTAVLVMVTAMAGVAELAAKATATVAVLMLEREYLPVTSRPVSLT